MRLSAARGGAAIVTLVLFGAAAGDHSPRTIPAEFIVEPASAAAINDQFPETEPVYGGQRERIQFRFLREPLLDGRAVLINTTMLAEPPIEPVVDHLAPAQADSAPAG